jgi:hypothetical protein
MWRDRGALLVIPGRDTDVVDGQVVNADEVERPFVTDELEPQDHGGALLRRHADDATRRDRD